MHLRNLSLLLKCKLLELRRVGCDRQQVALLLCKWNVAKLNILVVPHGTHRPCCAVVKPLLHDVYDNCATRKKDRVCQPSTVYLQTA